MKRYLLLSIFIFSLSYSSIAQTPYSFNKVSMEQTIPTKTLPTVDITSLLAEDALNTNKEIPYRFGYKHSVNLGINNGGLKQTLKDGSTLWRIGIVCPEAYSINLIFDQFQLPEGAILYLYSADKSYLVGPYTSKNNSDASRLGTDLVKGESIIVEYYEPKYAAFHAQLHISNVTHGYRDPFQFIKAFGESGNCHNNSICPVASDWQDDKRSVAIILVGGNAFCTGSMLGNVALDGTPYFLTANHCYDPDVASWVFRFNYESPTCTPSANGPTSNVVSGSVLRAKRSNSDFCLLELNDEPDPSYQVFYAGWNNQDVAASNTTGIHHPSGDVKKISFDNGTAVSYGYFAAGNTHWSVDWDNGVTEGGSSGSPLFDQNHRVIGQLHGGPSSCTSSDKRDFYGKFSLSWDGTNSSQRLKDWLDGGSTGATTLNGYYPGQTSDTLNIGIQNISSPYNTTYCLGDSIIPVIKIKNSGLNPISTFIVNYSLDGGAYQTYTYNGASFGLYGSATITLPGILPAIGNHNITFFVSNPNNGSDQNLSNDTLSQSFSVINGSHLYIEIKTDDFPLETSFHVINISGDTILNASDFTTANTIYNLSVCAEVGCYDFKIYDSGNDGICCSYGNGYYKIKSESGAVLAQGGNFTANETKNICLFLTAPEATFNSTATEVCAGTALTFTNTSSSATAFAWLLSGPASGNGTALNYSYSFNAAGNYNLRLIAINNVGNDTSNVSIVVNAKPTASISTNITSSPTSNDGSVNITVTSGLAPYTFSWSNGNNTEDLINIAAGSYTVTITDSHGCMISKSAIVESANGIEDANHSFGINIYPNPSNGVVSVDWIKHFSKINISLLSSIGTELKSYTFLDTDNGTIELNDLANGVYFLKINIGDNVLIRKITVLQ